MVASRASSGSEGTTTHMFGRLRMSDTSNTDWWVAPSGPWVIPALEPASFTFSAGRATCCLV